MKTTRFLKRIFASIITVATVTTLATASLTQSAFAVDYSGSYDSMLTLSDGDTVGLESTATFETASNVYAVNLGSSISSDYISINATSNGGTYSRGIALFRNTGELTIADSEISNYYYGIDNYQGSIASINNVTISSQYAGIYNSGGTITSISYSKISDGSSYGKLICINIYSILFQIPTPIFGGDASL